MKAFEFIQKIIFINKIAKREYTVASTVREIKSIDKSSRLFLLLKKIKKLPKIIKIGFPLKIISNIGISVITTCLPKNSYSEPLVKSISWLILEEDKVSKFKRKFDQFSKEIILHNINEINIEIKHKAKLSFVLNFLIFFKK